MNLKNPQQKKLLVLSISAIAGLLLLLAIFQKKDNPSIKISSVTASDKLRRNSDAKKTIDKKKKTAWITTRKDYGKYQWILFRFTRKIKLSKILMINGFAHKHRSRWIGDLYDRYSRIRSVRVKLSDNSSYLWLLKDNTRDFQTFTLPVPRETRAVTLYIHNIYKGSCNKSSAISELKFR